MKKNIQDIALFISKTMERNLINVQEVLNLNLNDLVNKLNELSDDEKEQVVSIIINSQLESLKTMTMEEFLKIRKEIDELTDYYTSKKNNFDTVVEEGDYVADQILFKIIGHNERKLILPVDISIIKKYCFSTELKEEQFYDALMWIALRYVAISICLDCQSNNVKMNN